MKTAVDHSRKIEIMGILNLTPDSFYAPSRDNFDILQSGADIIDIGAFSTRPGHSPVSEREEWRRLQGPLKDIMSARPAFRISIDSFMSGIIRKACEICGPVIANDVTAGEGDEKMLRTVAELGLTYIPMHHGPAEDSKDVRRFYAEFEKVSEKEGVTDWIVDPGFGFGKTVEQNYGVFHSLETLLQCHRKVLVGISRKSMIWKPAGITPEESLARTSELHLEALERGTDILRVHDVEAAREVVALYRKKHDGV